MGRKVQGSRLDAWLTGLLRSLLGVFVGAGLIIGMVVLLAWNEIRVLQAVRAGGALAGGFEPNGLLVWAIRPVGLALLVTGFALVGGPLGAVANAIAGFGAMVRFGTRWLALMAGLGVAAVTMALVWVFYQPLVSLAVLAGAVVAIGLIGWIGLRIADVRYRPGSPLEGKDRAGG